MNQSKKEEQNYTVINSENYRNDPIANQVVQKALNLFNEIIGENSAFTEEDRGPPKEDALVPLTGATKLQRLTC